MDGRYHVRLDRPPALLLVDGGLGRGGARPARAGGERGGRGEVSPVVGCVSHENAYIEYIIVFVVISLLV